MHIYILNFNPLACEVHFISLSKVSSFHLHRNGFCVKISFLARFFDI